MTVATKAGFYGAFFGRRCLAICSAVVVIVFLLKILISAVPNQTSFIITTTLFDANQIEKINNDTDVAAKETIKIATDGPPLLAVEDKIYISDLLQAFPNATIRTRDLKSTSINGRCLGKSNGRRILINYASNCCQHSQPKNCETGLTVGGFDVCIMFNEKSLDAEFAARNKHILSEKTGGGYWLWKPYIVMKVLYTMRDNDVLMYTDSGTHFIANVDLGHVCLLQQLDQDIVVFSDAHAEHILTKPDAFVLMDVDANDPKYGNGYQLIAAYFMIRKSLRSLRFVGEWLTYAQDYRIIANGNSQFAKNPPDFRGHRNDQSILSLLSKKWNIEAWPDPSQWGENGFNGENRKKDRFKLIGKTFFAHTRDKS